MTADPSEVHRLRRWSDAVLEIGRLVNADDQDGLLDRIAAHTAQLTGYDFCAVQLHDAENGRLLIAGSYGLDAEYIRHVNTDRPIRLSPGDDFYESPSSRAIRGHVTVAVPAIDEDAAFSPWRAIAERQGYRSMLAVPMLVEGDAVGVLACYSRRRGAPSEPDRRLTELMAEQAAVAINTALLRRRERAALTDLEETNRRLRAHQDLLERAEVMHRSLMRVVLADRGLDDVARALSEQLQAPVMVEDAAKRVLADSGPAGNRAALAALDADAADTRRGDDEEHAVVVLDTAAGERYWVGPVMVGGERVGRLWIGPVARPLGPLERRTVERGAIVVALELLKRRSAAEVELRQSGDVLTDLLLGEGRHRPDNLRTRAAALGHDLDRPHRIIVAALRRDDAPGDPDGARRRLAAAAAQAAEDVLPRPLVGTHQDTVVLLLPDPADDTDAADAVGVADRRRAVDRIATRWRTDVRRAFPDAAVSVVIGDTCDRLDAYPKYFAAVRGALRLSDTGDSRSRVVDLRDFGVYTLLLHATDPAALTEFARERLGSLRAWDTRRRTDLLATVREFLRSGGRTGAVAAALRIHPNTVLNRLARAEQLAGLDLNDPHSRLQLQLALMVEEIAGLTEPDAGPA